MKVTHLTKKIDQQAILEDVNFDLVTNEIVGLIGRNGSGKTTLFRTIAGHYYTDGGEITINDKNIELFPKERQHIFYIDIICQIKRDKTFHLRNSKKLLMVFGNLVIF